MKNWFNSWNELLWKNLALRGGLNGRSRWRLAACVFLVEKEDDSAQLELF